MTDSHTTDENPKRDESRRGFIRGSSLLLAGALPATVASSSLAAKSAQISQPFPEGEIRIGLVGCGYQGLAIASQLLTATNSLPVRLTAMADAFPDRFQQALRTLRGRHGDRVRIKTDGRCLGLQAYRDLLATDVHVVVLATPPVFRPAQFEAAIATEKHVYAELPIAVDVPGVTRFKLASVHAASRGCVVRVGWPHRHDEHYRLTIARLQAGAIGEIRSIQACQPVQARREVTSPASQSELHAQLRNWMHMPWASGGPLVEQRVQILDIVNWLMNGHPLAARPTTVLQTVGDSKSPTCNDFCEHLPPIEFTYNGGVTLVCQSSTVASSSDAPSANLSNQPHSKRATIWVQGSSGQCDVVSGEFFDAQGKPTWSSRHELAQLGQHQLGLTAALSEFLHAITSGQSSNEVQTAVEGTLTAILGRTAAACKRPVSWDECVKSQEVFDCINLPFDHLGVDRAPTIERYLAT